MGITNNSGGIMVALYDFQFDGLYFTAGCEYDVDFSSFSRRWVIRHPMSNIVVNSDFIKEHFV